MAGQAPRGSRGHGRSSRPGSSSPTVVAASVAVSGPTPTRMTPGEAASLTAFICGLPTSDLHWSLKQLNQLLFLRRMQQTGRFGGTDGDRRRMH